MVAAPAAILESYLGGQASGSALVDVLYGDVEPGGRLAETFPSGSPTWPATATSPVSRIRSCTGKAERRLPTPHHRWSRAAVRLRPRTGYTTFEMGEPSLDRMSITHDEPVAVKLPVTNTGSRRAAPWFRSIGTTGPVGCPGEAELAGFAKVHLDAGNGDRGDHCR